MTYKRAMLTGALAFFVSVVLAIVVHGFRAAEEIRAYVSVVREGQAALDEPLSEADFQLWADWHSAQADRIQ